MMHKLRYREMQSESRYLDVLENVTDKISKTIGFAGTNTLAINSALWDTNPTICFGDDRKAGFVHAKSAGRLFEKISEYIKLVDLALSKNKQ